MAKARSVGAPLWADGVYLQARTEPQAECMLVLIGATPGQNQLPKVIKGVKFRDGIEVAPRRSSNHRWIFFEVPFNSLDVGAPARGRKNELMSNRLRVPYLNRGIFRASVADIIKIIRSSLLTVFFITCYELAASASTNTWMSNGSSCVPGDPAIQNDLYLITAGTVVYKTERTGLITLYCPVTSPTTDKASQLTLTYALSNTSSISTASISAELIRLSRDNGGFEAIAAAKGIIGSNEVQVLVSHTFDFSNFYYYVRVDMNRTDLSDGVILYGVGLDQN